MVDPKNMSDDDWKQKLTPEQFRVCRMKGTEMPFSGKYVQNHADGMYHCIACDQPLFSSDTKFESGSGWPSFYEAVDKGNIELREDTSHDMIRTEILCKNCGSHLGHMFPAPSQTPSGEYYCINSTALDFKANEAVLKDSKTAS